MDTVADPRPLRDVLGLSDDEVKMVRETRAAAMADDSSAPVSMRELAGDDDELLMTVPTGGCGYESLRRPEWARSMSARPEGTAAARKILGLDGADE